MLQNFFDEEIPPIRNSKAIEADDFLDKNMDRLKASLLSKALCNDIYLSHGGGFGVSFLTLYSDYPSSNPVGY